MFMSSGERFLVGDLDFCRNCEMCSCIIIFVQFGEEKVNGP